ncbi:hypothetical protein ACXY7D_11910 [Sphingomonas melonis]
MMIIEVTGGEVLPDRQIYDGPEAAVIARGPVYRVRFHDDRSDIYGRSADELRQRGVTISAALFAVEEDLAGHQYG